MGQRHGPDLTIFGAKPATSSRILPKGQIVVGGCFDCGMKPLGAYEIDLSRDAIRGRVRRGRWQEPFPGVYFASKQSPSWEELLLAACEWARPDGLISFRAAGRVWRIPGFTDSLIELTTVRDLRAKRDDVIVHRVPEIDKRDRTKVGIIPVTAPTRTILDLAGVCGRDALQSAVDDLVRRELTSWERLMTAVQQAPRGRRGTGQLRAILAEGRHSYLERVLKRIIDKSPLPKPIREYEVLTLDRRSFFVDFAYPLERVAIEADSWEYHSSREAFQHDREKWRELSNLGWTTLCFTHQDAKFNSAEIVATIAIALNNAVAKGA